MANHPYREGIEENATLVCTTGNEVDGYRIDRHLGIVRGIIVRTPSIGKAFIGAFRSLGGGNVKEYVEVCEMARHEAHELMVKHAKSLMADAIIGLRYDATEFMQGATEVLAYGTAVQLTRKV